VRWVFRPRALAGPAIRASAVGDQVAIERHDQSGRTSSNRLTTA
jgi:hypothetical protein